jgi:hypothetical protein
VPEVTVTLTEADLADGRPRHPRDCPLGLACERELGGRFLGVRGNGEVVVRPSRVRTPADRLGVTAGMSDADRARARRIVEAVDRGLEPLAPQTLTMLVPD